MAKKRTVPRKPAARKTGRQQPAMRKTAASKPAAKRVARTSAGKKTADKRATAPIKRKARTATARKTVSDATPRERASRRSKQAEWTMPAVLVSASTAPELVTIGPRLALAIDGAGAPASETFTQSLQALYGIAYTLKFARKKSGHGTPFKVAPLEGRWSAEGWTGDTDVPPPENWRWRLRICVPPDVTSGELQSAVREATGKKGGKLEDSAMANAVMLEQLPEQRVGRILHVGPYADEPRSFEAVAQLLATAGLKPAHTHVEIYLGDPRRTDPARQKTVLLRELAGGP